MSAVWAGLKCRRIVGLAETAAEGGPRSRPVGVSSEGALCAGVRPLKGVSCGLEHVWALGTYVGVVVGARGRA